MALAASIGPPTAALCAPGQCVFGEEWKKAKLLERTQLTHDTILVTFGLAEEGKPLGLSTCACILAMIQEAGDDKPTIRPYTPVSTNAMIGKFQLVVKVYEQGKLGQYLQKMPIGESLDFKHIEKNVKVQYPFGKKHITILVGGTGITPMIQALHAILGTAGDASSVTVLFGNKTQKDILCKDLLEKWASDFAGRLKVVHVLSEAEKDEAWAGPKGFIDKALIQAHCVAPSEDQLVMVCGPPPMYDVLCGPRDKPEELTGLLSEMGYNVGQVFKF